MTEKKTVVEPEVKRIKRSMTNDEALGMTHAQLIQGVRQNWGQNMRKAKKMTERILFNDKGA